MIYSPKNTGKDRTRMKNQSKWITFFFCTAVFIIAILLYVNTIGSDFIWDDEYLILKNSQIKDFSHIGNVFKTYVGFGSENVNNFYRPIQEISNMVDYFLWGLYPAGFHLTNIILHALVAVLVLILLKLLTKSNRISFIAAIIWAVHPIHTEAVAYIAGRADSLYALFMLLSFIFFIKHIDYLRHGENKKSQSIYYVSITIFILALLSKEISIVLPVLLFLYLIYFTREEKILFSRVRWTWTPYAFTVGIYVWLRVTVLNFAGIAPESAFKAVPLVYRILTFFRTVLIYFRLIVAPLNLHMERTVYITKTIVDPATLMALGTIFLLIWSIFKTYKHNKLVSFSIAWFFINLLPVSNIFPINSLLAEHWLYMASIGVFLIIAIGVNKFYVSILPDRKSYHAAAVLVFVSLVGVYSALTVKQNNVWKNEITFFENTLKYNPRNARLYLNLGNTYYERGEIDSAITEYKKALEIDKNYAVAYGNIGSSYLRKNNPAEAEKYLVKAVEIKFNYPIAHYNLGVLFFKKRDYGEALKELKLATEQLPQFFPAWNMKGQTYLKTGKEEEAKKSFQRSLKIMPDQPEISSILQKL